MLGPTNAVGGAKLFAAIGVTYPAGATVTCSNGKETLIAKNTPGQTQWVFAIPKPDNLPETWTVTATANDGSDTSKTETVEITTEGQWKTVELAFALVIFDNGDQNKGITGGWSKSGYSDGKYDRSNSLVTIGDAIECTVNGYEDLSGIAGTVEKVPLDGVNTLTITGNLSDYDSSYSEFLIGLSSSKTIKTPAASVKISSKGNFSKTLNVSSYNDSYYVFVAALRNDDKCTEEYIAELSVTSIVQTA